MDPPGRLGWAGQGRAGQGRGGNKIHSLATPRRNMES